MLFRQETVWHKVFENIESARLQIPLNKAYFVKVSEKNICLAHTDSGFYAVNDKCPHNGFSLSKGWCENNTIVCPLHRHSFDLNNGRTIKGTPDYVDTYPIKITEEGFFVGITKRKWKLL